MSPRSFIGNVVSLCTPLSLSVCVWLSKFYLSFFLSLYSSPFLVATEQLYGRVCPSVERSICKNCSIQIACKNLDLDSWCILVWLSGPNQSNGFISGSLRILFPCKNAWWCIVFLWPDFAGNDVKIMKIVNGFPPLGGVKTSYLHIAISSKRIKLQNRGCTQIVENSKLFENIV